MMHHFVTAGANDSIYYGMHLIKFSHMVDSQAIRKIPNRIGLHLSGLASNRNWLKLLSPHDATTLHYSDTEIEQFHTQSGCGRQSAF